MKNPKKQAHHNISIDRENKSPEECGISGQFILVIYRNQ